MDGLLNFLSVVLIALIAICVIVATLTFALWVGFKGMYPDERPARPKKPGR